MILGMTPLTFIHVLLSLIGIASGFVVVFGMIGGKRLDRVTTIFLVTTVLTSVTGFFFPITKVTPGIVIGILSLIVLAIAFYSRYSKQLAGPWSRIFAITAVIAQFFNFFVLIVQSFMKVPALHALAPTQTETPFKVAQIGALILFLVLGVAAAKKFHSGAAHR